MTVKWNESIHFENFKIEKKNKGGGWVGKAGRQAEEDGSIRMLLNIYCEIHEVCSLCVNKNIIIYLIKYRKQNSLSLNRLHPFLRYSGVASLLFQSTDPPWWYLLQSWVTTLRAAVLSQMGSRNSCLCSFKEASSSDPLSYSSVLNLKFFLMCFFM